MQQYNPNPSAWGGAGVARSQAEVDSGLRSFMLGVYNNMTLGLAVTGLVALGLTTALFGLIAGTAVAAMIVTEIMRLPFTFLIGNAALAALVAVLVSVGLGLIGTFRILGQKPAPYLRNL